MAHSHPISCSNTGWRRWLPAALLALLVGCSAPPVNPDATPHFGQVLARFVAGRDDQVIEVSSLDRIAIRQAVLVMPDGKPVLAYSIDAGQNDETPVLGSGEPGMPAAHIAPIGQILSVALIRVPDPDDYAHGWREARVEVDLGDGTGKRTVILAAPAPI